MTDIEAPSITCSPDITLPTINGENFAEVTTIPDIHATDNSGFLSREVCSHDFPSNFILGSTLIDCIAIDAANNSASCQFQVHVIGKWPSVVYDLQFYAIKMNNEYRHTIDDLLFSCWTSANQCQAGNLKLTFV